jgi:hypothetical protein
MVYDSGDPACTPGRYPAGTGFVDVGGAHVHLIRNGGEVPLVLIAFQLVPAGAPRRIDAADPGICPHL